SPCLSVHSSRRASQNNAHTRVSTLRRAASWQHMTAQPRRARSDHSPHHARPASHIGRQKHGRALHMKEANSLMPEEQQQTAQPHLRRSRKAENGQLRVNSGEYEEGETSSSLTKPLDETDLGVHQNSKQLCS
ncbi:hypothetical protein FA95DRAFT_1638060, partial [Auriscalpium vulgare]